MGQGDTGISPARHQIMPPAYDNHGGVPHVATTWFPRSTSILVFVTMYRRGVLYADILRRCQDATGRSAATSVRGWPRGPRGLHRSQGSNHPVVSTPEAGAGPSPAPASSCLASGV